MSVCFGRQPQQPSQWAGYQPQPEPEPEPDQGGYVDFTAHAAYEPLVTPQPAAALQLGAPGGGGVYLGARRDVPPTLTPTISALRDHMAVRPKCNPQHTVSFQDCSLDVALWFRVKTWASAPRP